MSKMVQIQLTKTLLVLYENEILSSLPQELLVEAIRRGKGVKRSESHRQKMLEKRHKEWREGECR